MCRIAGLWDRRCSIREAERIVENMCSLQKHGGPDDSGLYASAKNHLVLGNRRLALLDLGKEGHMPMSYRERYHITYNGELYNHMKLRKELLHLGHQFSNHTDTEVMLAAFAEWGTKSFSQFNGMFAFAIWDAEINTLYLGRDAAGIKPLYYDISGNKLVFASEIRAFEAVYASQSNNTNWPVMLMAYGFVPEPVTTLSTVRPLPKGCFLTYNLQENTHSLQSFKHYSYSYRIDNMATAIESTREVLADVVQRQLLADAPIGVFLSGGLDSSILASLAVKQQHGNLNTLSLFFEEKTFSEKEYQDAVIAKLGCKHHQYLLTEKEFEQQLPQVLYDMDQPSCDGINTWFISRYAASLGLKAVLSGLGGDELYGGYPSFMRMNKTLSLQKMPDFLLVSGKNSRLKKLNRLAYLQLPGIKGRYLFLRGHYSVAEIARQMNMDESQVWQIIETTPSFNDTGSLHHKDQAGWMEWHIYMQNQLLRDADVMSMKHSIEIRVPFLDDANIQLAMSLSPDLKYIGPKPKQFLINSFGHELPDVIWNRPKMGFAFPFAKWMRNSVYVRSVMEEAGVTAKSHYQQFMKSHLHWSHLMSLLILRHRRIL